MVLTMDQNQVSTKNNWIILQKSSNSAQETQWIEHWPAALATRILFNSK